MVEVRESVIGSLDNLHDNALNYLKGREQGDQRISVVKLLYANIKIICTNSKLKEKGFISEEVEKSLRLIAQAMKKLI